MELETLFLNKTCDFCEYDDFYKALEKMINDKLDIVYYTKTRKFYVNKIAIFELQKDGLFYFDNELNTNDGDLIKNIKCSLKFDLLLGGVNYATNNVLNTNSQYHNKTVRIYLNPNDLPEYVELSYDCYLFDSKLRNDIIKTPNVLFDGLCYTNGMILKK